MILMDENLDGRISRGEFARWYDDSQELHERVEQDWSAADKNKDGLLSQDEYLASEIAKHAEESKNKKAALREYVRMNRKNATAISKQDFLWYTSNDDFGSADLDHDFSLSWDEYRNAPFHFHDYDNPRGKQLLREFRATDLNGNGEVSLEEFNAELRRARQKDMAMEEGEDDFVEDEEPNTENLEEDESTIEALDEPVPKPVDENLKEPPWNGKPL